MDALFQPLASALGASVDQVKLITCLIVVYPLGSVYIRLPAGIPALKHLFSTGITMFFLIGMLDLAAGFAQLLASVLSTYYIAKYVQSPKMPWIVFCATMGHLLINHTIRALLNLSYETMEVTGPQMVLTMKLTTFAWNVYDGRRPVEELDKWQLEKRVVEYPSLLAFLGYAFYFPGFLVGPYLDYASYDQLVKETLFTSKSKGKEGANGHSVAQGGRRVPKGRKRVAYKKLILGLAFLGIYVTQIGSFNLGVVLQDWFLRKSFWYRFWFLQLCGFMERTKYYAIWTLTEGASILTGLGFSGYGPNGETYWTEAANVDIMNIELAENFKVVLDAWNMKTNIWLRECVYKRVTPKGTKPGFKSSMLTFGTSALWHGIAGGYYIAFFFGGFVQTVGRLCRSNIRPLLLPADAEKNARGPATFTKRLYDLLGVIAAVALTNYTVIPFMLLSIRDSLKGWAAVGWYGHILVGGAMAFFHLGGASYLKKVQAKRVKKVGSVKKATIDKPGTPNPMVVPPVDIALEDLKRK